MLRERLPFDPPEPAVGPARVLQAIPPLASSRAVRRRGSRLLSRLLKLVDGIALAGGMLVTQSITGSQRPGVAWVQAAAASAVVGIIVAGRLQLYRSAVCQMRHTESAGLLKVAVAATAVATAVLLRHGHDVTPWGAAVALAGTYLMLEVGRGLYEAWLRASRRKGRHSRSVAIVAGAAEAKRIARLLAHAQGAGCAVAEVVDAEHVTGDGTPLTAAVRVTRMVTESGAAGAILGRDVRQELLTPIASALVAAGVHVSVYCGLEGIGPARLLVHEFSHDPFLYVSAPAARRWHRAIKRAVDVTGAAMLVLAALPVLAAAALAIKAHDGGRVLFCQQRVGLGGRRFTVYKLRTMVEDAEGLLPHVSDRNERTGGPLFTCTDDPRVTPVGRWLRCSSLDELPQLFNVIAGTMSLIGPRPPLPAEAAQFDAELQRRFSVRPGITGLWQVEARRNPLFWAYRRLDLYYVDNWSLGLDLAIALATLRVISNDLFHILTGRRG